MTEQIQVYSSGPFMCSACAPEKLSAREVEEAVNRQNPTGISSSWKVSSDPTFKGGEPNPCKCNDDNTRKHWLLSC